MVALHASDLKLNTSKLWKQDALPPAFAWMGRLSPLNYRLCLVDLHAAVALADVTDDWHPVARLVDDWEAAALVDANPEFARLLLHADEGEYTEFGLADL